MLNNPVSRDGVLFQGLFSKIAKHIFPLNEDNYATEQNTR